MQQMTTQKQIRAAFWYAHPNTPRRKIKDYSGNGLMHQTDTRAAFANFVDFLQKNGFISEALAQRATL